MGSGAKQRTTAAKLNREAKLRQRRAEKAARKAARKLASADPAPEAGAPVRAPEDTNAAAA
jgi:hypothetical protein